MRTVKFLQQGVATLVVMMLLIAGVLVVLTQTTGIIRNRSYDTAQDSDSAAALMLAESGMQRALGIISLSQTAGTFSASTCTGIATGAPFSVGRGTISYSSVVESPSSCTANACSSCTVTSVGTVGSTQRTLSQVFSLGTVNGTTGRGTVVNMVLQNTYTVPAIALFSLAWRRQSNGGNANATITPCSTCSVRWNYSSSSGNPSNGGMGISLPIAASVFSETVTQTLSKDRDYVEVGALFPSTNSTTPTVLGSYWSNVNNTAETSSNSGSSGAVYSGVVTSDTTTCTSASTTSGTSTNQACFHWCTSGSAGEADTLAFGLAARSSGVTAETTAVAFNTTGSNGYPAQNINLVKASDRIVHYPNTDGSTTGASGQVYAEVWYKTNTAYTMTGSFGAGAGASSYPRNVVASAGGQITLHANMSNGDTTFTADSISGFLCVGDAFTGVANLAGRTISAVPGGGTCSKKTWVSNSTPNAYTISSGAGGTVNKNSTQPQVTSTKLIVAQDSYGNLQTGANLQIAATNTTGITVSAAPATTSITSNSSSTTYTYYTISSTQYLAQTTVTQGTTSSTIYLPSSSPVPSAGTTLQVYSLGTGGSGVFVASTTVGTPGTNSFTVTDPTNATPNIKNAVLCGGICALFNEPSSTTAQTAFTLTSTSTSQWTGGFMCLKGVDATPGKIKPVSSSSITKRTWAESIQ